MVRAYIYNVTFIAKHYFVYHPTALEKSLYKITEAGLLDYVLCLMDILVIDSVRSCIYTFICVLLLSMNI